jgi:hypothetical protein
MRKGRKFEAEPFRRQNTFFFFRGKKKKKQKKNIEGKRAATSGCRSASSAQHLSSTVQ